ncbi:MAG: cbb3-type cytochrome c oxidase subunit I [Planctomycetota bacterium]|jgi:cytochrome c oxidase subunit 1|nr:cbb3-type cytochrome c oxidase subunit I [Planctomycetota bacterium]
MSSDHIHPEPTTFLRKHVFSVDHKVIAKQFLWFGLIWLGIGGVMAMMLRWQLANPGVPVPLLGGLLFPRTGGVIDPAAYNTLFTMHGTIMIFLGLTPAMIGALGNWSIPLMIGARDMIFPTLNMLSFWAMFAGGAVGFYSLFVPLGATEAGWTGYPTLSTTVGAVGQGETLWAIAVFLIGASSIMGGINYITTVIRLRCPGMSWMRLPLTVWGLFLTSILNVLFIPVIGSAMILLVLDRVFGTAFYVPASIMSGGTGGDPILYQHLFWIFGHPEVYILILPAWGVVCDLLSFFARKPAFGYRTSVGAMVVVTVLSAVVYGHHMFTTGMSAMLGESFMLLTMIISVPAEVLFFNWLHTLWKGSLRFTTPMLFAMSVIFVFGLGGLTGIYCATIGTDIFLHDTYFIVGHFHLTMAASALFGTFGAIYFWFPKMFGRMMSERLGKLHFWLSFVPLVIVFCIMFISGYAGMPRRYYDHTSAEYLRPLQHLNVATTVSAFLLGAAQLIFVYNFIKSRWWGKPAPQNPWEVGTLDWTIETPVPHYNFKTIPVVQSGPHEYSNPVLGPDTDWIYQTEKLPG